MFALVLFTDNIYYICKEKDIIKTRKGYSIKYKNGRYAGTVIARKDNYKELEKLKIKSEHKRNIKKNQQLECNKKKKSKAEATDYEHTELSNFNNTVDNPKDNSSQHSTKPVTTDLQNTSDFELNKLNQQEAETINYEHTEASKFNNTVDNPKNNSSQHSTKPVTTDLQNTSDFELNKLNQQGAKTINYEHTESSSFNNTADKPKDNSSQHSTKPVIIDLSNGLDFDFNELNQQGVETINYKHTELLCFNNTVDNPKNNSSQHSTKPVTTDLQNTSNFELNKLNQQGAETINYEHTESSSFNNTADKPKDNSSQHSTKPVIIDLSNGLDFDFNELNQQGVETINYEHTELLCFNNIVDNPKNNSSRHPIESAIIDFQNGLDFDLNELNQQDFIRTSVNVEFVNNSNNNRNSLPSPNLQTEQEIFELQATDDKYFDTSLEDASYPPRFNLINVREDENEDTESHSSLISKSTNSSYMPDSDASENSNISNKENSKTSIKDKNQDLSKTSHNSTLESALPLGHNVPDDTNMFVKTVESGNKKDFCIYCKTEQSKLSRHLRRKHKDEKEIKDIFVIPKGRPERRILIKKIRKDGQYFFNTNSDVNTGELKVMRRPNTNYNKNASDFSICPQCKGNYSKSALRHHYRKCKKQNSLKNRTLLAKSRKITGRIHESACKILRERVFPTIRDDSISRVIRYDELAIDFANKLCEKFQDPHFYDMIRQKLRQIGRLLLEMKNQDDEIDDLFSIFVPQKYDNCLNAVRVLAGLNESGTGFKTPSLATSLGTLLKQLCKRCITVMIKRHDKEKRELAEEFLKLMTEDYSSSIARTAIETQHKRKRYSTKLLPTQDDIKKLENYLNNRLKTAHDALKQTFSLNAWEALAESCLLSIQLFNRRRPGEIERALIEDFQNYEKVNENTIGKAYLSLSNDEKKAAKRYVRFTMRGKLGRPVPVLLHKQMLENLKLLLSYRKTAKVHEKNPYLFGISGLLKGDYRYLRACDLMRKYSEECGASNPDRLRGTNLRKHIATMCTSLNLKDYEVSDLANFMGHADKIHKEHYRQPILSREIFQVSKLLEIVHGKDSDEEIEENETEQNNFHQNTSSQDNDSEVEQVLNKPSDKNVTNKRKLTDSVNVENYNTNSENSTDEQSTSGNPVANHSSSSQINKNKKKRSTSPFGKCVRQRWTEEEKNIAYAAFKHHIISKTLPSLKEIQKLKDANPYVFNRNSAAIKTWVNNQIKKSNS